MRIWKAVRRVPSPQGREELTGLGGRYRQRQVLDRLEANGQGHGQLEQRFLALHVAIDRAVAQAEFRGHIRDVGPPIALVDEHLACGLGDVPDPLAQQCPGHGPIITDFMSQ